MAQGKISRTLNALSSQQNHEFGHEIERLIKNEMRYAVNKLIRDYSFIMEDTFGWTREDLLQNVRIRLWRGLATFDETLKIKKTSYLAAILNNYFLTLLRMCRSKKNSQSKLTSVPEITFGFNEEEMAANDPDILLNNQMYETFLINLSPFQRIVFDFYFVDGYDSKEILDRTKASRRHIERTVHLLKRAMVRFDVKMNGGSYDDYEQYGITAES